MKIRGDANFDHHRAVTSKSAVKLKIRVSNDPDSMSLPKDPAIYQYVQDLTIWVAGRDLPSRVVRWILQQCCYDEDENNNESVQDTSSEQVSTPTPKTTGVPTKSRTRSRLKKLHLERRDNDWDAPNTLLRISAEDDETLAEGLLCNPVVLSLENFSMVGFSKKSSIQATVEVVCQMPQLVCLKLAADLSPSSFSKSSNIRASSRSQPLTSRGTSYSSDELEEEETLLNQEAMISPEVLQKLFEASSLADTPIQRDLSRVSLLGLFPETNAYKKVLQKAYVDDACIIHIFLLMTHSEAGRSGKPSRFSYYIREIQSLNQLGRYQMKQKRTNQPSVGHIPSSLYNEEDSQSLEYDTRLFYHLLQHSKGASSLSSFSSLKFWKTKPTTTPGVNTSAGENRRRGASLDSIYILVRENPWIFCQTHSTKAVPLSRVSGKGIRKSFLRSFRKS